MSTTNLYVEHIVIGAETAVWIFLTVVNLTDVALFKFLNEKYNNLFTGIIALSLLYILGVVFDRFCDTLFKKKEDEHWSNAEISESSLLIAEKAKQEHFFYYTRTRVRILRATIVNLVPITLSTIWLINTQLKNYKLAFFVFLLGSSSIYFSNKSLNLLLNGFYKKVKFLESYLQKEKKEMQSHNKNGI